MADTVRFLMEEMIPELEDLVAQHYFSRGEVKAIVKRRQEFEYLLKRKAALKEDFLRYVEYEAKLEELRKHRCKALHPGGKKKTLSDYAIVRRIHFIFERALRKFGGDVGLWTAWLEYCRASGSGRRLGRVAGRALQLHPGEPGLWVYAAAWEFEANGNPAAARALMQQGLRMCRGSARMWLDFFDMELMYVEKLVARRRVLGLDVPDGSGSGQQQQQDCEGEAAGGRKRRRRDAAAGAGAGAAEAHEQEDAEGPEEDAEVAAVAAEAGQNLLVQQQQQQADGGDASIPTDPQEAVRAVLTGAVAKLVFENALKAAAAGKLKASSSSSSGGELGLRASFLAVAQRYSSVGALALQRHILDGLRRDFPQEPEAVDLLARAACDPADASASAADVQAAVQEYERLLGSTAAAAGAAAELAQARSRKRQKRGQAAAQQQQPDAAAAAAAPLPAAAAQQLYRLYCRYLRQRFDALTGAAAAEAAAAAAQQLFRLHVRAHEAGAADEQLYDGWVALARQLQQHKMALKASRLACGAHPASARAWLARLQLEQQAASSKAGAAREEQLLGVVTDALARVPAAEAEALWVAAFELCRAPQQLVQLSQLLLDAVTRVSAKGPDSGGLGAAAAACLAATWVVQGAGAARELWRRLALLPPAGGDMFRSMVRLELQAAGGGAKQQQQQQQQGEQQGEQQQLPADALRRVRALYDAWAGAYGGSDAELWVSYALLEQAQAKAGAGRIYWRAVKALDEPEAFIEAFRSRVGLV